VDAIILEQEAVLTSIKGIGKKMAEQIILSLKDKIKTFGSTVNEVTPDSDNMNILKAKDNKSIQKIDKVLLSDTLLALESLGYNDKNIMPLIHTVYDDSIKTSEDLLKQILKEL
jgi:Holliday junction resolvasome RuvABC DNA-binding subunit